MCPTRTSSSRRGVICPAMYPSRMRSPAGESHGLPQIGYGVGDHHDRGIFHGPGRVPVWRTRHMIDRERQRPGSPLGAARSLPFRAVLVGEYRLETVNVERLYGRTLSASPGSLSRERRRHSRYQLYGISTGPAKDCLRRRQYVQIAALQVQTRPPPSPAPQEPAAGVRGAGTASPGRRSRESRGPSVRTRGTPDCW